MNKKLKILLNIIKKFRNLNESNYLNYFSKYKIDFIEIEKFLFFLCDYDNIIDPKIANYYNRYDFFICLLNNSKNFDMGLIIFLRFEIFCYIEENKERRYSIDFNVKLGNLLSDKYYLDDDKFLWKDFYQENLMKLYEDAENIIIYITPFVLKINLEIFTVDIGNNEIDKLKKVPCYLNNKHNVNIIYRKLHYDLIYDKIYFERIFTQEIKFIDERSNIINLELLKLNATEELSCPNSNSNSNVEVKDINNKLNEEKLNGNDNNNLYNKVNNFPNGINLSESIDLNLLNFNFVDNNNNNKNLNNNNLNKKPEENLINFNYNENYDNQNILNNNSIAPNIIQSYAIQNKPKIIKSLIFCKICNKEISKESKELKQNGNIDNNDNNNDNDININIDYSLFYSQEKICKECFINELYSIYSIEISKFIMDSFENSFNKGNFKSFEDILNLKEAFELNICNKNYSINYIKKNLGLNFEEINHKIRFENCLVCFGGGNPKNCKIKNINSLPCNCTFFSINHFSLFFENLIKINKKLKTNKFTCLCNYQYNINDCMKIFEIINFNKLDEIFFKFKEYLFKNIFENYCFSCGKKKTTNGNHYSLYDEIFKSMMHLSQFEHFCCFDCNEDINQQNKQNFKRKGVYLEIIECCICLTYHKIINIPK
jgi:hypothetical protein